MVDTNEQMYFTLGYMMHMPEFNAANEISDGIIDANFTMGPGVTPQGELLWDPNADNTTYYQLKMKAVVSVSASPPLISPDAGFNQTNQSFHQQ